MKLNKYQHLAMRTNANLGNMRDLEHAVMGLCTEVGEFANPFKRHIFYAKPLDTVNMIEELGDILWYTALAATALGTTLDEVAKINITKLSLRYPDKFSTNDAIERKDKL
jgi:NTP pyrophosphatase (non-canonical NTP hydrolase)